MKDNFRFTLHPEGIVSGRVCYSGTGEPAAGIRVEAQGVGISTEYGYALTGSDGTYIVRALQEDFYNIFVDDINHETHEWTAAAAESIAVDRVKNNGIDSICKGGS
jgi:hypothetical protein